MPSNNLSIHPRAWKTEKGVFIFADRAKRNTCEPRKLRANVERAIAGTQRHCDDHPSDAMARSNLDRLKAILDAGNLRNS
jgi:hypothetical protein